MVPPFLDNKAKDLLLQARTAYLNLQLNKFEIIGDLEGQVTWFPWVGTRTINAASLLIEIASGEHPQRTELTIKSNYSSLLQTAEFANKLGMESCFDQIFNLYCQ